MNKPLITVTTFYYNDQEFLADAISSVLAQTHTNFEYILVNHASTDKSRKIAHSFNDPRIKHIDLPINYGAGAGLNLWDCLPRLKGELVKVFCADDVMLPHHLESLQRVFLRHPNTDVAVSPFVHFIDEHGTQTKADQSMLAPEVLSAPRPQWELLKCYFNSSSPLFWGNALFRKEALSSIYHDNSMIYLFDMSVWADLLIQEKNFFFLKETISSYRQSNTSMLARHSQRICQACFFEHSAYCRLFYQLKNMELAKYLCEHVPGKLKDKFTPNDTDLIPFLIALEYAYKPNTAYPRRPIMDLVYLLSMYEKIYSLLQDATCRERLQNRFGFTIKEFRALYTDDACGPLFAKQHKLTRFFKQFFQKKL